MTEPTSSSTGAYKPHPEDINSPDAIVKALYDVISGPAGKRNWSRLRSLFLEGARMIPIGERVHGESGFKVMSVDEWIEDASPFLLENDFYESEIVNNAHRFGNMIQAFSTYEAKESPDGPQKARGINGIQLLYKDDRWWIVTMMWDNETRDNPLPGEFTPYLW